MMLHRLTIAAAALFAMAVTAANAQNPEAGYQDGIDRNKVEINSFEDLQNYFRYSPKRDVIISAHRGGMVILKTASSRAKRHCQ